MQPVTWLNRIDMSMCYGTTEAEHPMSSNFVVPLNNDMSSRRLGTKPRLYGEEIIANKLSQTCLAEDKWQLSS